MKDAHKNLTEELAAQLVERFASPEVKQLLEDTKAASDTQTGTFEVVITTENLDRYQEVISLSGWELEHYRNNPVVLWGHDHNQPIGMALSVDIIDGKMIAKGKFAPTDKAQEIRRLYEFGIIKATSVGFIEKEREGNLITKAELLEFSFVSVPANPFALSLAMEKGLGINDLVTKGLMFVEPQSGDPVIEQKGAVEDEQDAVAARQKKWKNFQAVDDVVWAFMNVYFDPQTPVADFTKLLDETIELLKKVNGSEKAAPAGLFEVAPTNMRTVLQRISVALEDAGTTGEPEGDEALPDPTETDDARAFKEFAAKRKLLQDASTVLGDVLAETRRALNAGI